MSDLIEIPAPLLDAKTEFEAAKERQAALVKAHGGAVQASVADTVRLADIDREIEAHAASLGEDDALAAIADAGFVRMPARDRAAVERRLAELRAEHTAIGLKSAGHEAASRALSAKIAAAGNEVVIAAKALIAENGRLGAALEPEFARDVGRLTLPELFRRWHVIDNLGHPDAQELRALAVAIGNLINLGFGPLVYSDDPAARVLFRGKYNPDRAAAPVDWTALWREDPASVALNRDLLALGASVRRAVAAVEHDRKVKQEQAERERQAEQRRRQEAYKPVAVTSTYRTSSPISESERHAAVPNPAPAPLPGYIGDGRP